jgi:hypothetical protein
MFNRDIIEHVCFQQRVPLDICFENPINQAEMKDKISHVSDFDRRKHDPSNNNKPESGLAFCCCKLERRRSFSFGTNFKEIPRGDNSRSSVVFNSCRK